MSYLTAETRALIQDCEDARQFDAFALAVGKLREHSALLRERILTIPKGSVQRPPLGHEISALDVVLREYGDVLRNTMWMDKRAADDGRAMAGQPHDDPYLFMRQLQRIVSRLCNGNPRTGLPDEDFATYKASQALGQQYCFDAARDPGEELAAYLAERCARLASGRTHEGRGKKQRQRERAADCTIAGPELPQLEPVTPEPKAWLSRMMNQRSTAGERVRPGFG